MIRMRSSRRTTLPTVQKPSSAHAKQRTRLRLSLSSFSVVLVLLLVFFACPQCFCVTYSSSAAPDADVSNEAHHPNEDGRVSPSPLPPLSSFQLANPEGTYRFEETDACSSARTTSNPCLIHYPAPSSQQRLACDQQNVNGKQPNVCIRTAKGFKPPDDFQRVEEEGAEGGIPNQDRSLMIHPLAISASSSRSNNDKPDLAEDMLLFLADGHGPDGHVTAEAVQRDLPFRILRMLQEESVRLNESELETRIPKLLQKAFLECDKEVALDAARNSGTTAIVVLKVANTIFVASVGDSTAALMRWNRDNGTYEIAAQAEPHKPHLPEERKRIESRDGRIFIPPSFQRDSSRVILPTVMADGTRAEMALAMSRCLGDKDGKIHGWLLAEPTVLTIPLEEHKKKTDAWKTFFVLVASDGVTDHNPLADVITKSGLALFDETSAKTLGTQVDDILKTSADGWARATNSHYRDDMTLILAHV